MKKKVLVLVLAFLVVVIAAIATPGHLMGQAIGITARGGGPYVVYADGAEYSRHTTEREAIENASEALAGGAILVWYWHDYTVDVEIVGQAPPPPPPDSTVTPPPPPDSTVTPPPPPAPTGNVIWASSFRNTMGFNREATLDEGRWTMPGGYDGQIGVRAREFADIIPGSVVNPEDLLENLGTDWWPTPHVLKVGTYNGFTSGDLLIATDIPGAVPAVGESWFIRWYQRVVQPDSMTATITVHGIQDNTGTDIWMSRTATNIPHDNVGAGEWQLKFRFPVVGTSSPYYSMDYPTLLRNETYRVELQVERVTATQVRFHSRLAIRRNGVDVPLYGDADLVGRNVSLADSVLHRVTDLSSLGDLTAGVNGFDAAPYVYDFMYQGAFAICRLDWCGAFTREEAPERN